MDVLRRRVERALAERPLLTDGHVALGDLAFGSLATLNGSEVCGRGDRVAGVATRYAGRARAIALFAMEPEEALVLLRRHFAEAGGGAGAGPLGAYEALGRESGTAVVAALLGDGSGAGPDAGGGGRAATLRQEGDATLEEDSVIASLLATHAPSDTALAMLRLELHGARAGEAPLRAHVYVLVEGKPFVQALGGLVRPSGR